MVKRWVGPGDQFCTLGFHQWAVSRLIDLSRDLKVYDVPLAAINMYHVYENLTLRDMVMHMNAAMASDLTKPIILDEDGELMDGRHRIMKALFLGCETIKVVRFQKNPAPCKVLEK
jgi:hypothetical protein